MIISRGVLIAILLSSGGVSIGQAQPPRAAGLADSCTSCHGIMGHSSGRIPSIGGLPRAQLIAELKGFRAQAGNPTIMNRIARGYSDVEIEALADYFSSIGKP
jgi:cytochrome subunit of sulfide dehydrogenase